MNHSVTRVLAEKVDDMPDMPDAGSIDDMEAMREADSVECMCMLITVGEAMFTLSYDSLEVYPKLSSCQECKEALDDGVARSDPGLNDCGCQSVRNARYGD